jgi:hypothetical protein
MRHLWHSQQSMAYANVLSEVAERGSALAITSYAQTIRHSI